MIIQFRKNLSMLKMKDKELFGSETAKDGFRNEEEVIVKFNNWKKDKIAQEWLVIMGYVLNNIEYVKAVKITGNYRTDVQVQVTIKLKEAIDCENLSIKLASNPRGFNQIDKREIEKYVKMWRIPKDIEEILKGREKFTADWMLVILKKDEQSYEWALKDINVVMNIFGQGDVRITEQGSLKIGQIGMQRKGGDGGRESAKMLQFKINPCLLFKS